jgi:hypothetical protein
MISSNIDSCWVWASVRLFVFFNWRKVRSEGGARKVKREGEEERGREGEEGEGNARRREK